MARVAAMMTVKDVARYLRVHHITVYRMVHDGRLPAVRVGRVWRFHRHQIDRWLVANGTGHQAPERRAGPPKTRRRGA